MRRPRSITMAQLRARPVRARGAKGPQDGRWYWRATAGSRSVWTGWGTPAEVTAELGRRLAADPELGAVPERSRDAGVRTVGDLMRAWAASTEARPLAERSVATYRSSARRIAGGPLGAVLVERLKAAAIEDWVAAAVSRGLAPKTVRLDLRVLAMAWDWARRRELVRGTWPKLQGLPKDQPRERQYTPPRADVRRVLEVAREQAPPWVGRALELQLATGARIGEIASLTWAQVDAEASTVELRGKTGARTVPVPEELVEQLQAWPRTREHVLGVTPKTVEGTIAGHLQRLCEEAGVKPWTTHALRRLAVDRYLRSGVGAETAADLMGHGVPVMMALYRQVTDQERRHAAAKARLWDLGEEED